MVIDSESVCPRFSLKSISDLEFLAGVLRLSTKYKVKHLRDKALYILESYHPSKLSVWDELRSSRPKGQLNNHEECPSILVVNLARELGAWSILPAAMALLANDASAGRVFGVRLHEDAPPLFPTCTLNRDDEQGFALMKEYNHISIVKMLKFTRTIGKTCNRPPELTPSPAGRAPVGASSLKPTASLCWGEFKEIVKDLLDLFVFEKPVGYADFVFTVGEVKQNKTRTCKKCWQEFKMGQEEKRTEWWDGLPDVLGFSGWTDDRLHTVELDD